MAFASIVFYYLVKTKKLNLNLNVKNTKNIDVLDNNIIRLIIPILVFLVFFFLIDLTFSMRIGLSFLGLLNMQTNMMILGVFFLIELLLLLIMFLMYALPSRLIHDMMCKTLIENKYQRVSKFIVTIAVFWVGIQLYLFVLFNIILSFIPLSSISALG